ncbi:MAG TPA: DUF1800 domain-containing protein [Candidatus Dormibacteraeota bacterium]|nr:DUF1800 domain-containing protein [Candidatus Dormibacteraeota bacterium]
MAAPLVSRLLGQTLHALGLIAPHSSHGSLLGPLLQAPVAPPGPAPAPVGPTDDRRRVARLFARAGFGATVAEIDQWAAAGYAATVDHLLSFTTANGRPDDLEVLALQEVASVGDDKNPPNSQPYQRWWLQRMATTPNPLEEKLTLHWHGHFATGYVKVRKLGLMIAQNRLLRSQAAGDFRALCKAITVDPAMLIWLDGNTNRKGRPNENYGREFMELFSLGHDGGYTQNDVREAARALTGWTVDQQGNAAFNAALHDGRVKTLLGQTGPWAANDVVDIVLDRHPKGPVAAHYVAGRLAAFLHRPDPEPQVVQAMADAFVNGGYQIKPMVRTLLLRPEFSDGAGRNIKSPAELVAGSIRGLSLARGDGAVGLVESLLGQPGNRTTPNDLFAQESATMGQVLFDPPNVAGWHGGTSWANTATLLARYNFAAQAATLVTDDQLGALLDGTPAPSPQPWMLRLGLLDLFPATSAAIDSYVAEARAAKADDKTVARGVLTLLLASPDYNLR